MKQKTQTLLLKNMKNPKWTEDWMYDLEKLLKRNATILEVVDFVRMLIVDEIRAARLSAAEEYRFNGFTCSDCVKKENHNCK